MTVWVSCLLILTFRRMPFVCEASHCLELLLWLAEPGYCHFCSLCTVCISVMFNGMSLTKFHTWTCTFRIASSTRSKSQKTQKHTSFSCLTLSYLHSDLRRRANTNTLKDFLKLLDFILVCLVSDCTDGKEWWIKAHVYIIRLQLHLHDHTEPTCYVRKAECHVVYSHLPSGMIIKSRVMVLFWQGSNFMTAGCRQEAIELSKEIMR